jgi:hypothetical protein
MPRQWFMPRSVAFALCLFNLAAFADTLPDPPATHRSEPQHWSARVRCHAAEHATQGQFWSERATPSVQPLDPHLTGPITGTGQRGVVSVSYACISTRGPPQV